MGFWTSIITTGLIKHIVAIVGNTEKGIINIDYKVIIEALMEIHFEMIVRRSATFVRNQITGQLGTLLISKRRHITSFARV